VWKKTAVNLKFKFYVDNQLFFILILHMRVVSLLIVLVISVSVVATGFSFPPAAGTGTASFQTLDVCHSSAPVVNPELPYISSCPCAVIPVVVTAVVELPQSTLHPVILAFQDERPPKI
jgi:hypothetical protein